MDATTAASGAGVHAAGLAPRGLGRLAEIEPAPATGKWPTHRLSGGKVEGADGAEPREAPLEIFRAASRVGNSTDILFPARDPCHTSHHDLPPLAATGGRDFDVILEMPANVNLGNDIKLLASRGRVVVIGSRGDATLNPRDLMGRRASIHGTTLGTSTGPRRPKSVPPRKSWKD